MTKITKTLYEWCIINNRQDILLRWDYELNNCSPNDISYGTKTKYWFKCDKGIHPSELKLINSITCGQKGSMRCNACNSFAQWAINNICEDFIEKYWDYENNTVNPWEISYGCKTNIWIKCINCGSTKYIKPNTYICQGLSCPKCSDGISYPNKLMYSILQQLIETFETEKKFSWCKYYFKGKYRNGSYDFYFELNDKKYIVEMDGKWHNNDNNMSNQSKEDSQFIDNEKDRLAKLHNIEVIRIDSSLSDLEYIRRSIINSKLSNIFDLSTIDWINCNGYAYKSLIKIVCNLWNEKIFTTKQIATITHLDSSTVIRYLKKGAIQNWCDYNPQNEILKSIDLKKRKVYCIELDKIFNGITEASKILKINYTSIGLTCNGKQNTAGDYHWMYYEDYLHMQSLTA